MFNIFSPEQYLTFLNTKFIKEKLLKEFELLLNDQNSELDTFELEADAYEVGETNMNFVLKFYTVLKVFLNQNISFFTKVFDKMSKDKVHDFFLELFKQLIHEYKERLTQQFISLKLEGYMQKQNEIHVKIFNQVILGSIQKCQDIVLTQN